MALGAGAKFVTEDDCFGYFAHRLPLLTAEFLQGQVGIFLIYAELPLQDSFGPLHELSCFKLPLHLYFFRFNTGQFHLGADKKSNGGDEADLTFGVVVGLAMLEVDDANDLATAENGDGKKGLIEVFREIVKHAEARIGRGMAGDCHGLPVFGNPSGNTLAHRETESM